MKRRGAGKERSKYPWKVTNEEKITGVQRGMERNKVIVRKEEGERGAGKEGKRRREMKGMKEKKKRIGQGIILIRAKWENIR